MLLLVYMDATQLPTDNYKSHSLNVATVQVDVTILLMDSETVASDLLIVQIY